MNQRLETSVPFETFMAAGSERIDLKPQRRDISRIATLAAIIFAALALRLPFLTQKSLWLDEIWSIGIARMSWASFWSVVHDQDPNMSLYYASLHVWMKLGSSEFVIRLLSVFFGAATVPVVYALGNRLFGRSVALIASVLLTINVFHIQWSQEARSYSLVVFLVALSSLFFVKSIEEKGWLNWVAYAGISVLAVYAHLFGALVLAAHWASLLFRSYREVPWKGLFSSTVSIGVLSAPLAELVVQRSRHTAVPFAWVPRPTVHGIYDVFYTLSGNGEFAGSEGGKPIVLAYLVACFAAISWGAIMRKRKSAEEFWRIGFLFSWLFVPLFLVLLVSLRQSMFLNRYLLICVPALVLLAAAGIGTIKRRDLMSAAALLMLCLSVSGISQYYHFRGRRQEWKSATEFILTQAHPGDALIFHVAPGRLLFDYYADRYYSSLRPQLDISFPDFRDENDNPTALAYSPPLRSEILDAADSHSRVWLILYQDEWSFTSEMSQHLRTRLAANHAEAQERKFEKITVVLYSGLSDRYSTNGISSPNHPLGF